MLEINQIHIGNALSLASLLEDNSIHMICTSPPYWGLRDYGLEPSLWPSVDFSPMAGLPQLHIQEQECCLGLETDPFSFIGHMVLIFRELKKKLREDGSLWLNLGDSYNSPVSSGQNDFRSSTLTGSKNKRDPLNNGHKKKTDLKQKDLIGIPWRVAFALQADGWFLRSDIIWAKPNPMPESVKDRPTKAHEYVFLLAKSERYFYDQEAVREPHTRLWNEKNGGNLADIGHKKNGKIETRNTHPKGYPLPNPNGRNKRTVWEIATQPYSEAHFATFPQKLIEPMILAGCPEFVCFLCGAPHVRVVEPTEEYKKLLGKDWADYEQDEKEGRGHFVLPNGAKSGQRPVKRSEKSVVAQYKTIGYTSTCSCDTEQTEAGIVLDPFMGSGTVARVAIEHKRRYIGFELNAQYAEELASKRTDKIQVRLFS